VISFSATVSAVEQYSTRTNWVENTITNLIEIRMPRNHFVNQYHTNWVERVTTNVFDVFRTNRVTRRLTNNFAVEVVNTNFVDSYRTNWKIMNLTNTVAVNLVRTNFVDAYHTNWQAFVFTNWQTVLVMKTNSITQIVTNVVQVDLPIAVAASHAPAPKKAAPAPEAPVSGATPSDDPVIEVSRTTRPPANRLVEVQLRIRWPLDTADAPPVQQWRIEREDGAILSFGQEQELKKELPIGNYKVEAKLQRDEDSPAYTLRGTLTVTIKEVLVQQRPNRAKLASVSE
jgi:hypothetical protein